METADSTYPVPEVEHVVAEAFDAGSFFDPSRPRGAVHTFSQNSVQDEHDLVAAARAELHPLKPQKKPTRAIISDITQKLLASREGLNFAERVGQLLRQVGREPPTVTVEYQNLTVEADALLGGARDPTVGNAFRTLGKRVLLQRMEMQPCRILKGIDGVLKPGRLTLLVGPPGSGKSVLLQALAGRLKPGKHLRITGSLKYNGVTQKDFVARRTIGLVEQYDNHIPNLGVLETLEFASHCQTSPAQAKEAVGAMDAAAQRLLQAKDAQNASYQLQEDGAAAGQLDNEDMSAADAVAAANFDKSFYEVVRQFTSYGLRPHMIMKIMGLEHVADTLVGNQQLRGVSGGERKRVTTAEIMVGAKNIVLFDEISTGLDSATTFSVVKTFGDVCRGLNRTFLISLLQPPPEVFYLFDDLLLLTDGRVIYHGPVQEVLPFFADSIGFACPVRKDPGSFLQEVTTPLGQMLYATPALLASKGLAADSQDPNRLLAAPPKDLLLEVSHLADTFWGSSAPGKQMLDQLYNHPFDKDKGNPRALSKDRFANGWGYLTRAVLQRQVLLNRRMKGYYIARVIQTIIIGIIIGTLFLDIQPTIEEGRNVLAICTLSVMFLAMMSGPQLAMVFGTKRVFYKQRDANYFGSMSYALGLLLTQVPQSTLEAVLFSVIVYFLSNLTRTAGHYFIYLLVTWSASNSLAGLFRFYAYASPTMVLAQSIASIFLLLLILTNGFSIVATSIPWYIRWIYYCNPLAWAMRALIINEMTSSRWDYPVPGYATAGEAVLDAFGVPSDKWWIWAGVGYQWFFLGLVTVLGAAALHYMDPPSPKPTVPEEEGRKELSRGLRNRLFRLSVELTSRVSAAGLRPKGAAVHPSDEESVPAPAAPPVGKRVHAEKVQAGKPEHVVVPFIPITLVCRDIRYYVDDPSKGTAPGVVTEQGDKQIAGKLELLKGISVYTKPGQLTALMGGSGAGKTTLMDVICGRKTQGIIRGDILVNSHPKQQATWSRVVGYVEQSDVISSRTTVKEALLFSARMRLDEKSISMGQVKSIVEETMQLVELAALQTSVVGDPGGDGLSIEQRKRLSIAIELVANPSVVFMDEPTSGLDARAAAIVMRSVKNVARSNRNVMVTIHQPSMEIFEAFDTLVLLQRGGRLTYFGPLGFESCELIKYLEACPGVEPIKPGYNPATWMLEVTGGSMSTMFASAGSDFPTLYAESSMRQENDAVMAALAAEKGAEPLKLTSKYATSLSTQRKWLVRKFLGIYWYSPSYNFVRLIFTVMVAIIYGITYLNEGKLDEEGVTIATVQNIMGLTFSMAIFLGMMNCMTVQPLLGAERTVYYKDRATSMYSPMPYLEATTVAELPYLVIQAVVMVSITYWMVGYAATAWQFFYYLLVYFLTLAMYTCFGQLLVYMTPNQLLAQLLSSAINQLWTFFNGFLIPRKEMPVGWQWMNRISPTTYILYGLAGSQLTNSNVPMVAVGGAQTTVSAYVKDYWGYESSFIWWCALIVFGYVFAFRIASMLLLRFVSFERR